MIVTVSPETEKAIVKLAAKRGQDAAVLAGRYLEIALKSQQITDDEPDALTQAIAKLKSRAPEQIAEARDQLFQAAKPSRPLPAGQSIFDVIGGQWPGDETDEEVLAALEKLS